FASLKILSGELPLSRVSAIGAQTRAVLRLCGLRTLLKSELCCFGASAPLAFRSFAGGLFYFDVTCWRETFREFLMKAKKIIGEFMAVDQVGRRDQADHGMMSPSAIPHVP